MQILSPTEVEQKIQAAGGALVLLDVREQWEFDIVHLPDSILIPLAALAQRLDELDPQRTTVVICHHGIRSHTAGLLLERSGFRDVINLAGGLDEWARTVDRNMPVYG